MPKISFIIAAFNEEAYLRQCVQSITGYQGQNEIEVVVVDDQSTDSTFCVLESLAVEHPEVVVPLRNMNKGKTSAYNFGYARATGDLFTFVGADDYIVPESIDARASVLNPRSDAPQISYAAMEFFQEKQPRKFRRAPTLGGGNTSGGAAMFNRALAKLAFPIPSSLPNEDTWLNAIALGFAADIVPIDTSSVRNRLHARNSWARNAGYLKVRESIDRRYEAYSFALGYIEGQGLTSNSRLYAYVNANEKRLRGDWIGLLRHRELSLRERVNFFQYSTPIAYHLIRVFKKVFR